MLCPEVFAMNISLHEKISGFVVDRTSLYTARYTNILALVTFVYVAFKTSRERIKKLNTLLLFAGCENGD
jgi:hypothetical protein